MLPCALPAVRWMRTFFLKSVEARTSASVCCTCNAAPPHKACFHFIYITAGSPMLRWRWQTCSSRWTRSRPRSTLHLRPAQYSRHGPQFASSYVFVKRFLADAGSRVQLFCSNLSQLLLDTVPALVLPRHPVIHDCVSCACDVTCSSLAHLSDAPRPLRAVRDSSAGVRSLLLAQPPQSCPGPVIRGRHCQVRSNACA
jgi:hypothetical protein